MSRAKIDYFIKYNLTINKIHHIYISSKYKVIETRQVKFAPFVPNYTEEIDELLLKTTVQS